MPILSGIRADERAEFRSTYPRNLMPVPKAQGISAGYLRPADGVLQIGTGQGVDRGGINWDGRCYRVSGTSLIEVEADGTVTVLGDVGAGGQVSMDYSFDRLAIASGGQLWLWDGTNLTMVTDSDIGQVNDVLWVDGYFMTTDGEYIVVTELLDPAQVDPLKYGSSEADPDPVQRLLKIRREVHAVNRYTIEVFDNVGGEGFPFARIDGAQVSRGAIGKDACCLFAGGIAMIGSGRNEAPSVWLAVNGASAPLATREIDQQLQRYTGEQLAAAVLEARVDKRHELLLVHLPDQTLVYDAGASAVLGEPIWHVLTTSVAGLSQYRVRGLVWCFDRWIVGDPSSTRIGVLSDATAKHWGQTVGWEFGTVVIYPEGGAAVVHELELVGLPGRVEAGTDPVIWTSYSLDGETWSLERSTRAGSSGQRNQRIAWRKQGQIRHWRIQRFRGTSDARISFARLEAQLEPLNR